MPHEPKTTFNVGRIGGGTSVNAIPFEAWMEVDMRSADAASLQSLDAKFHKAVDDAVARRERAVGQPRADGGQGRWSGNRPAGRTAGRRADRAGGGVGDQGARVPGDARRRLDRCEHPA